MVAVAQANTILDWFANLLVVDRPPPWMWHLDEELKDWFEQVKERHDAESNDNKPDDDREVVPLMENELFPERLAVLNR